MIRINVFWTGGLDSTCRILELSLLPEIEIYPYYIKMLGRKSTQNELDAIFKITSIIRNLPNYLGNLQDVLVFKIGMFNCYPEIHNAQHKLAKTNYRVGSQYSYCADLCKHLNIKCEVCLENEPTCGAHKAILHDIVLKETTFNYLVDLEKSELNNLTLLFKDLLFPKSIFLMSKQNEIKFIEEIDSNILNNIVFCHNPQNNKPCGECSPCRSYKKLGLQKIFNIK